MVAALRTLRPPLQSLFLVAVLAGWLVRPSATGVAASVPAAQPLPTTAGSGAEPAWAPGPGGPAGSSAPSAPAPPGHPAGSTFLPLAHGYDASFPQCAAGSVPDGAAFSIIGVNRGKAFTANPCLGREWRAAAPRRPVYLNSGFSPKNSSKVTAGCRRLSKRLDAPAELRRAYAIGCSEAVYSRAVMRAAGVRESVMWWIDVERANSWDEDVRLNRSALQGEVDQLAAAGPLPGLYSTARDWGAVMGSWSPDGVVANWVAARTPQEACGSPGFSGAPVWLVQEAAAWPEPSGYDSDWAC